MKKMLILLTLFSFWLGAAEAPGGDHFTLKTINGKELHVTELDNGLAVKEYQGKVVFIEFWGTHCPPCLFSIPHYIDLQAKYKDKLAIIAIEVQTAASEDVLKQFAQAKGINYDIITYEEGRAFTNYIGMRTGWRGSIPFLIILDQKGNFITSQVGMVPPEALENLIMQLEARAASQNASSNASKAPTESKSPAPAAR